MQRSARPSLSVELFQSYDRAELLCLFGQAAECFQVVLSIVLAYLSIHQCGRVGQTHAGTNPFGSGDQIGGGYAPSPPWVASRKDQGRLS
jgi:hypothetical protein